jgi:hypothetical protein
MNFTLEDYEPIGHHVLLELDVKGATDSGIILDKKKADKWMRVAKVGSMVTAVDPEDYVIMGEPRGLVHLDFGGTQFMQVMEHDLAGKVSPKKVDLNQLSLNVT